MEEDVLYENPKVQEIARMVGEDFDCFIFEAVHPWIEKKCRMKISKRLLERAMSCFMEEHSEEFKVLQKEADMSGKE